MIAFIIRQRGDCEAELRICKGETLDEALMNTGYVNGETVFLGTITENMYRGVVDSRLVISIALAQVSEPLKI